MTPAPASSTFDRDAWMAWIAQRARLEMPRLAREARVQYMPPPVMSPTPAPARQPDTGALRKLDTAYIPTVRLIDIDVLTTKELVSAAIAWFYQRHRYLPKSIALNPIRALTIDRPAFFAVDCQVQQADGQTVDLCYTIAVESNGQLASDDVRLEYERLSEVYTTGGQW